MRSRAKGRSWSPAEGERLLVVSNRAPYSIRRRGGKTELVRTVGGLASTLDDTLRSRGGTWLAWSGNVAVGHRKAGRTTTHSISSPSGGYRLRLLNLTERQVAQFYHGFSNRALWPLCHYFIVRSRFDHDEWQAFEEVNRLFAKTAAATAPANGLVWVHDFQLALVPALLRSHRSAARIAMFWHIPFPDSSVFRVNPWAREILRGMLGSDLIGFHTKEYARHFIEGCHDLLDADVDLSAGEIHHENGTTTAAAFPLGIEAHTFAHLGSERRILNAVEKLRRTVGVEKLILGVDRLDYTKGILERLEAYEQVLNESPELHRKICFVQIQVPSRESVPEYRALREQIDRTVGRIVGRFSSPGWMPVRYLYRGFGRRDLAVYYRAADVMLVTALRDGMNLVAQEFVATRTDEDGVLILSEFAGAADRLREALIVNPYDRRAIATAIREAIHLKASTRRAAMRAMRRRVLSEDVSWWLGEFLTAAIVPPSRKIRRRRR